jgi:hypothetical protein
MFETQPKFQRDMMGKKVFVGAEPEMLTAPTVRAQDAHGAHQASPDD